MQASKVAHHRIRRGDAVLPHGDDPAVAHQDGGIRQRFPR